jgi:hypothetical protein
MYYGFRCYSKDGQSLGWLYTFNQGTELAYTDENFDWCKRWKTLKGADKNLDFYSSRWSFKTKGGSLKIEVMPETPNAESFEKSRQQQWNESHPDVIQEAQEKYDKKRPVWSFRPTPENLEWLEEERWNLEDEKLESDAALLNRKLAKLRELERQGF